MHGTGAAKIMSENEPLRVLFDGVEITRSAMLHAFEKHEIKKLQPMGSLFDPLYHEAVCEVSCSVPKGRITSVILDGYTLHDRVIRAAKVCVSNGLGSKDNTHTQTDTHTHTQGNTDDDSSKLTCHLKS
eukprot:GHVR01042352.1.p2 GENE.GHVR01042352.1~~GHVR01042352.1.p2  ORF type:complete len:129 (+),score=53.31 GHVR01042352.1:562-948(+)